eukprot:COSAG02_NODE_1984_length_10186_cov_6.109933_9_plen_356_part_00
MRRHSAAPHLARATGFGCYQALAAHLLAIEIVSRLSPSLLEIVICLSAEASASLFWRFHAPHVIFFVCLPLFTRGSGRERDRQVTGRQRRNRGAAGGPREQPVRGGSPRAGSRRCALDWYDLLVPLVVEVEVSLATADSQLWPGLGPGEERQRLLARVDGRHALAVAIPELHHARARLQNSQNLAIAVPLQREDLRDAVRRRDARVRGAVAVPDVRHPAPRPTILTVSRPYSAAKAARVSRAAATPPVQLQGKHCAPGLADGGHKAGVRVPAVHDRPAYRIQQQQSQRQTRGSGSARARVRPGSNDQRPSESSSQRMPPQHHQQRASPAARIIGIRCRSSPIDCYRVSHRHAPPG